LKKKSSLFKEFSKYISIGTIGLHLVSGIIVGVFVGYYLDKFFNTSPILTIVFFFLGIITGFYNMYKDVLRYIKEEERKEKEKNEG